MRTGPRNMMKRRQVKGWIWLAAGVALVLTASIGVAAWIEGGQQPMEWVEIPVAAPYSTGGGAA